MRIDYVANGSINWSDERKVNLLVSLIKKGYSVESIANRMFTTQSSIRGAINKHTPGILKIRKYQREGVAK